MQVVYTPAHLGHDISIETYMGTPIPANEVAERAERIRMTLEADGGFPLVDPTEHFAVNVPETAQQDGHNVVEVFEVTGRGALRLLARS